MRFSVERDVIIDVFKKASRLRAPSALVPNLDKILVKATDTQIEVQSTNITQILRIEVPSADVLEVGTAVFPRPADMVQFLSSLPDGAVSFDVVDSTLLIAAGSTKTSRQLVPAKDYPALPDLDVVKKWHQIPAGLLSDDLSAVLPAANGASSPHFAQVRVLKGVFYGSDGLSAHVQQVSGYECPDMNVSLGVVPLLKSLIFASENEFVEVGFAKGATLFKVSGLVLLTYDPTVSMPDVNTAVVAAAVDNDQILEIDRDEMSRAVMQVRGTTDNFSAVHIHASKSGTVSLKSKSAIGQTETSISGEYQHPDQEFILSASSLMSALECYPQQVCKIFLGSAPNKSGAKNISPVRLSAHDGEGGSFVAVLSQLRKDLL